MYLDVGLGTYKLYRVNTYYVYIIMIARTSECEIFSRNGRDFLNFGHICGVSQIIYVYNVRNSDEWRENGDELRCTGGR